MQLIYLTDRHSHVAAAHGWPRLGFDLQNWLGRLGLHRFPVPSSRFAMKIIPSIAVPIKHMKTIENQMPLYSMFVPEGEGKETNNDVRTWTSSSPAAAVFFPSGTSSSLAWWTVASSASAKGVQQGISSKVAADSLKTASFQGVQDASNQKPFDDFYDL